MIVGVFMFLIFSIPACYLYVSFLDRRIKELENLAKNPSKDDFRFLRELLNCVFFNCGKSNKSL